MVENLEGGSRVEPPFGQTLSRMTESSRMSVYSKTFYEGELTMKTDAWFSKTKVFASILKEDASLYVIDQKLMTRINGEIPDRVDPYEDSKDGTSNSVLAAGWMHFEMKNCLVFPIDNDSKSFKIL